MAASTPESNPSPGTTPERRTTQTGVEVRVRRAPKFGVFLALGAVIGIVAAMVLTFAFDGTAVPDPITGLQYSQLQVFGFFALILGVLGVLLGGIVAVVLDRVLRGRERTLHAERETVVAEEPAPPAEAGDEGGESVPTGH